LIKPEAQVTLKLLSGKKQTLVKTADTINEMKIIQSLQQTDLKGNQNLI